MKKLFNFLYCFYKGCDEIVNNYPIVRDKNNPAICWVTDINCNKLMFWDKTHPNYKIRIGNFSKTFPLKKNQKQQTNSL